MTTTDTKLAIDVAAKISAEMLLGKIRLRHMGEPRYLVRLREIAMQFKKSVGETAFKELVDSGRPSVHALVAALFDAVTDTHRPATVHLLKGLHPMHRALVERTIMRATGKADREDRWPNELWSVKQNLKSICDQSISGLTLEEIREGYDPLIHAIVDHVYDRIDTLVN
ncbi:hypothetical protein HZC00_05290 [Candidatus Kaiserbacteria bacterium]|nr:hypothetical protein [Candidatus Kaiserbacteria bacterium]